MQLRAYLCSTLCSTLHGSVSWPWHPMGTINRSDGLVFGSAWCFCTLWAHLLVGHSTVHLAHPACFPPHPWGIIFVYTTPSTFAPIHLPSACACVSLLHWWWLYCMLPAHLELCMYQFLLSGCTCWLQWCPPTGRILLWHSCSIGMWCLLLRMQAKTLLLSTYQSLVWLAFHVSWWRGGCARFCVLSPCFFVFFSYYITRLSVLDINKTLVL